MCECLYLSLSLSYTHTQSYTHTLSLTHTRTHTHSLTHSIFTGVHSSINPPTQRARKGCVCITQRPASLLLYYSQAKSMSLKYLPSPLVSMSANASEIVPWICERTRQRFSGSANQKMQRFSGSANEKGNGSMDRRTKNATIQPICERKRQRVNGSVNEKGDSAHNR